MRILTIIIITVSLVLLVGSVYSSHKNPKESEDDFIVIYNPELIGTMSKLFPDKKIVIGFSGKELPPREGIDGIVSD